MKGEQVIVPPAQGPIAPSGRITNAQRITVVNAKVPNTPVAPSGRYHPDVVKADVFLRLPGSRRWEVVNICDMFRIIINLELCILITILTVGVFCKISENECLYFTREFCLVWTLGINWCFLCIHGLSPLYLILLSITVQQMQCNMAQGNQRWHTPPAVPLLIPFSFIFVYCMLILQLLNQTWVPMSVPQFPDPASKDHFTHSMCVKICDISCDLSRSPKVKM